MKLIFFHSSTSGKTDSKIEVSFKPDTCLLKNNKPFYYPDFSSDIRGVPQLVVKISAVGKCIEQRFASKYYNEVSIGIDLFAADLQSGIARVFDGAAPVGKFINKERIVCNPNAELLFICDKKKSILKTKDFICGIDDAISYISQYMTLRTGDLLFVPAKDTNSIISIGNVYSAFLDDVEVLCFIIK